MIILYQLRKDNGVVLDTEKSKLFQNMLDSNIKIDFFELVIFEVLANVKIIVIENDDFDFNLLKYRDGSDFTKLDKVVLYSQFDPRDVLFIHKTVNEYEELTLKMLLYKDKFINSFKELDDELIKIILQKLDNESQEFNHPTRFKYLKSLQVNEYNNPDEEEVNQEEVELEENQLEQELEQQQQELEGQEEKEEIGDEEELGGEEPDGEEEPDGNFRTENNLQNQKININKQEHSKIKMKQNL